MLLIRCTKKLSNDFDLKQEKDIQINRTESPLCEWYANLLRIDRRKCILFTNAKTLYTFLVPGVTKKESSDFGSFFTNNLRINLLAIDLPNLVIEKLVEEFQELRILPTNNRSILGSMNDYGFHCEFHIHRQGGLKSTDIIELNKKISKMPMSALKYSNGIKEIRNVVEKMLT